MTDPRTLAELASWYNSLPTHTRPNWPARGTVAAALVVLERLKGNFDLSLESHRAPGKSQIKGVSGAAVARILATHGETRAFLKEGGRTNRGGPGGIEQMLLALERSGLRDMSQEERSTVLNQLQAFLTEKVREFHNRQRLKFVYDPSATTWHAIRSILRQAKESGKAGPVAQHLVGAKLALRFPEQIVRNDSYSTADDQLGLSGDYQVRNTAFHVTVAPMPAVYDKCKLNTEAGLRVYLVVPDEALEAVKDWAERLAPGRIAAVSIETFVGQNLDELSGFGTPTCSLLRLLETYNARVDKVETDKSLMIEVPWNVTRP
jgi:hypothetical protein